LKRNKNKKITKNVTEKAAKKYRFYLQFSFIFTFFSQNSIKKAQKKQLVTRLFEQFLMFEGLE
jgi:hypothetical protein